MSQDLIARAARKLCEARGVNPDDRVALPGIGMTVRYRTVLAIAYDEVRDHLLIADCIAAARAEDS